MTDSGERFGSRAMLALIALASDLPMPCEVTFYPDMGAGVMAMSFDRVSDGLAWSVYLGDPAASSYLNNNGRLHLRPDTVVKWHGWHISIHASEEAVAGPALDEAVVTRLRDVVPPGVAA